MTRQQQSRRAFGGLALLALVASACAEERAPINRVQPAVLDKAFFVGADLKSPSDDPEFYSQGTLVDVGYGATQDGLFTSTYAQPMSRIKWVIQENLLIARLTYERIADSDGKGAGPASNDGIIVGAYRITSHFDVQRDYNSSTGEELNVLGENSSDRPWYERQSMRVDWSQNLNTDSYDFDTLSQIGVYGGVTYEPLAYAITDPNDADAPHFDLEDNYFDVTTKAFARPQMIDLGYLGWGIDKFPACYLGGDFSGGTAPAATCNPVELTIRQSFRRVPDNDYEPQEWDGHRFEAYGAFTTERSGYARNYGMTDVKWHRFLNRYNLWERSHFYSDPAKMTGAVECYTPATTAAGADPHADVNNDGTEDECKAVGRGSRCDTFRQRCTLPLRDRQQVTQAWYYSDGSNPEYFDGTEWATHEWDVALRSSVMAGRNAECKATSAGNCDVDHPVYNGQQDDNGDAIALAREVDDCRNHLSYAGRDCMEVALTVGSARGYSAGVIALARLPEALVLCHSPVEASDAPACGSPRLPAGLKSAACADKSRTAEVAASCAAAFHARNGDSRHHLVNVIQTPQTPSPWGIMVDSHDPLTGEKVGASINAWSHVTDLWSQGVVDLARYIKGELKTEDITEGTYVRDWAMANEAAGSGSSVAPITKEELQSRLAGFLNTSVEELKELEQNGGARISPSLRAKADALNRDIRKVRADGKAPTSTRATYAGRRAHAVGSPMEAELTTKMMQQYAGLKGGENNAELLARASPLRGASPAAMRDLRHKREMALADRGACIMNEAPAPLAMANLADLLEAKFGKFSAADSKDVQLLRAEKMRKFIAQRAHYAVIVHEMGHSIGLRHNFVSSSDAFGYRPQYWQLRTEDGANGRACAQLTPDGSCVGPRYFDPVNANEKKNLQWMFMQSSVMDYAGESTQDLIGLGAYDFAAARMFYGDVVSVAADPSSRAGTPRGAGLLEKLDGFGGTIGIRATIGTGAPGGATRNIHYSQLQKEYELIQSCLEVDPSIFKPANWNQERDGEWNVLLDGLIVSVDGKTTRCRQQPVEYATWNSLKTEGEKVSAVDPQGRVRMPYGFATDRWADLGNLSVFRHDNGADAYELFDFFITQQEVMHIFDNYRRNRQSFTVRGAASRNLERYNEKMRDAAKGLGLTFNIYKDFALEVGYDFEQLWPVVAAENFSENILASSLAFDHFTRQLARPQPGRHFLGDDKILRSEEDAYFVPDDAPGVAIPNGATGYLGNVSWGGKPLENSLATDRGEYSSEYTLQAGSYYEKAYTAMLMTESEDNFISSSRTDFLDARFRAVSLADLFPEGYRRWLANNLTNDAFVKGARLASDANQIPLLDEAGYPAGGIGWTSWWPTGGPTSCFAQNMSLSCTTTPANTVAIDPQVGWEQQKFLISSTLQYLPANEQQGWLKMLDMWELGADTDPGFPDRIEFHDPAGTVFIARTFGQETIFGKKVQRGVSARVLEYANELLKKAYDTTDGPKRDPDGKPLWYLPAFSSDGKLRIKYDPSIKSLTPAGGVVSGRTGCNAARNDLCTCSSNRACMELSRYTEVPFFMRQALAAYGLADPSMRGIY